jgi:hypothetical protein
MELDAWLTEFEKWTIEFDKCVIEFVKPGTGFETWLMSNEIRLTFNRIQQIAY